MKRADSQKQVLKRVFRQLKKYAPAIALSLFLAMLTVAGNLVVPILFGDAIDRIIGEGMVDFKVLTYYFIAIGAIVAVTAVLQWLMSVINNAVVYGVIRDIRAEAFTHIQNLPLKYIDSHSYGDVVSRCIADVDQFADGLLLGFTQLFTGVMTIIGTLVLMFIYNWIIALAVFVITPLSLFVAKFIASRTYSMFRKTSKIRGEQTAFIEEMVGNLKVVQAFGREDENQEKFDDINGGLTKASLSSIFFSSLTNPCTRFVNAVVYAAVALAGALTLIYPAVLPVSFGVGKLTTLLSYSNQYTKPFNEISGVVTEFQNAIACAGRIYELIDEPAQLPDAEGAEILEAVRGDVEFKDIEFSYDEDKPLIKGLNVSAKAGQRIAIVGPTGCGKTTLINLLMRFYDAGAGAVYVDGRDVRSYPEGELRAKFGAAFQNDFLIATTVRENIDYFRNLPEENILKAAEVACADEFIAGLEGGLDYHLAQKAANLSGGQKQRLLIARALAAEPEILVLDDSSSALDYATDAKLRKGLKKLYPDCTKFIIAQRVSAVMNADLIIVMDDGRVVGAGTHKELEESCEEYRQICIVQTGGDL